MLVFVIIITVAIINRVKYFKKFSKCIIGDKMKKSFRKQRKIV